MGAVHPRLEVGDRSVGPRQQLVPWRSARLFARAVLVAELPPSLIEEHSRAPDRQGLPTRTPTQMRRGAELSQPGVGVQPVGVNDRPRGRGRAIVNASSVLARELAST